MNVLSRHAVSTIQGCALASFGFVAHGQDASSTDTSTTMRPMFIQEYRVQGVKKLSEEEIGAIVYPFLGPERTEQDVEQARAALERAYKEKGFQTVTVEVPQQKVRRGVVVLQVVENKVGRLRVKGARFFSLDDIKRKAPSLAEGTVPDFNAVTRDIVALNTLPDRRVTPAMRPGVEPGTVDIDLNVKDTFPLHGSVELNNRASPDTTDLRLNGSVSYNNLWQLGHSVGGSFQISPQDPGEVKVYSGYYIARFPKVDWLNLMVTGTKQNSNVSTLGATAVAGRGEVLGTRAMITLPPRKDFYHSVSAGLDYKHFQQLVRVGTDSALDTPTTYYPLSATYNATWAGKRSTTELMTALAFNLRGTEKDRAEFENSRFRADSNFIVFRGELSHTQKLPADAELYAKVQGQLADQPLISSEQLSGGGLGTVRGYLEAEVTGDMGYFATLELRTPSLLGWAPKVGEWRLYAFAEGGTLTLHEPLPDQDGSFRLASFGFGSRLRLLDHLGGSLDIGLPLISQAHTQAYDPRVTFRVWADF
jgi:hemolysin activation/secretion protein